MTPRQRAARVLLVLLGLVSLEVGIWAQFFPRSFYDDFPGGGRAWVSADGPFNEHLVRDVGGLNLALGTLTLIAAVTLSVWVVRAAVAGGLLYSLPHFIYHLAHLEELDTGDQVAQTVSLALSVLAPLLVLWLTERAGGNKGRNPAPISSIE